MKYEERMKKRFRERQSNIQSGYVHRRKRSRCPKFHFEIMGGTSIDERLTYNVLYDLEGLLLSLCSCHLSYLDLDSAEILDDVISDFVDSIRLGYFIHDFKSINSFFSSPCSIFDTSYDIGEALFVRSLKYDFILYCVNYLGYDIDNLYCFEEFSIEELINFINYDIEATTVPICDF